MVLALKMTVLMGLPMLLYWQRFSARKCWLPSQRYPGCSAGWMILHSTSFMISCLSSVRLYMPFCFATTDLYKQCETNMHWKNPGSAPKAGITTARNLESPITCKRIHRDFIPFFKASDKNVGSKRINNKETELFCQNYTVVNNSGLFMKQPCCPKNSQFTNLYGYDIIMPVAIT